MKKNILVTATGGRSVGAGILHSLMRSSEAVSNRWNVVAADADSFSWGLYKAPNNALVPLATDPNYIDAIRNLVKQYSIDAIVPGSEAETTILSQNREVFDQCKVICNASNLMPYMNNKLLLEKKLESLDIRFLPTFALADFALAIDKFDFPFIIKPSTGSGGSKGLSIVSDEKELDHLLQSTHDKKRYCIQPYIGDADHEYTVGILNDKDGNLIDSIVMQRKLIGLSLLESRKNGSATLDISTGYSQGFIISHPDLQEFSENIACKFSSVGPLNIQLREHAGEYYIFDFHPRFSGTTPIRADVGFNEVDMLLRNHLLDERFSRIPYKKDVAAIRALEHVIVPIVSMPKSSA